VGCDIVQWRPIWWISVPVTGPRAKFPTALPVKRRVWILVVGVSAVLAGVAIIAWPKRTVYVVA